MSIRCRNLMALPALSSMQLVGGSKGLDRTVRWIYFGDVIDDMDHSPEWINGHEIVIYSGTAYSGSGKKLAEALRKLNDMDIAGLIINVGPYISEIPPEVIEAADELNLPLFRLPWEVKLVDVTHAICNAIIANEMEETRASSMLEGLLFSDIRSPEELNAILNANHLISERGCIVGVCACKSQEPQESAASDLAFDTRALQSRLNDALAWEHVHALTTTKGSKVIFLAPNLTDIKSRLSRIVQALERDLAGKNPRISLHIGTSASGEEVPDIKKSYRQARQALMTADMFKAEEPVIAYESLGISSLLLEIEDTSVLKRYYSNILNDLIEYDKVNRTELYRTLETFFDNDSDLQTTAQKLFIHKNTLKYRLERINEILGCNVRSTHAFLHIGIAFRVGKILSGKNAYENDSGKKP